MSKSPKVTTTTIEGARDFFYRELHHVISKQKLKALDGSIAYLSDLLIRHIESSQFFVQTSEGRLENNVLAELYAECASGSAEKKVAALRRLGDICLLITGLFPDSLNKKVVDLDYYFGMGGSAYHHLSQLSSTDVAQTYRELAEKIRPFSDVLGEFSEKNGIQKQSDVLRLYERWIATKSDRLRKLLGKHGILTPIDSLKEKH